MAFCSACGTQMADNTSFCPKCGKAAGTGLPAVAASAGPGAASGSLPMAENIAGMLATKKKNPKPPSPQTRTLQP
ncbi:MAG TPA: zinc-ribbon domain-containing protein [Terriglobales bacterium]